MTKIVLQHVTRTFGNGDTQVRALNDISTEFQHGSLIALMGPSGSGKTTMLNMIGALDRPDSGSILLNNRDIGAMNDSERGIFRRGIALFFNALP